MDSHQENLTSWTVSGQKWFITVPRQGPHPGNYRKKKTADPYHTQHLILKK